MTMLLTENHISPQELYERLKHIKVGGTVCTYSLRKCEELVPVINEILRLKAEKNAVILAHSYVSPEIIFGVADHVGDSLELSRRAMATDADVIVFAAVRFMAETAKILNPEKTVLIPGLLTGCTLADAIDAAEVRKLRLRFPEHTFVCYINTTAEVKAECDVCVTSANVVDVVARLPGDKIYFLPDRLMGENLKQELRARGVEKEILTHDGTCYVHEEYSLEDIHRIRFEYPDALIVSHPECKPEVCAASDFVGSTSQMLAFMEKTPHSRFFMLTECGLSSRLMADNPHKQFIGTCTLCRYMKSNSLAGIVRVLREPQPHDRIELAPDVMRRARASLDRMFRNTS